MLRTRALAAGAAAAVAVLTLPGTANALPTSIVVDGGFESPALAAHAWSVYDSFDGWTTAGGCGIEVQNNVAGAAYEGQQFVELDSYCPSAMAQTLTTVAGRWYTLTYAFSARPGVDELNVLDMAWNGASVDHASANGANLTETAWTVRTKAVQATSTSSTVGFADAGSIANSLGVYVDAVSVAAAPVAAVDACKNGGWMNYVDAAGNPFKNQGDCVSFIATGGRNVAAG